MKKPGRRRRETGSVSEDGPVALVGVADYPSALTQAQWTPTREVPHGVDADEAMLRSR